MPPPIIGTMPQIKAAKYPGAAPMRKLPAKPRTKNRGRKMDQKSRVLDKTGKGFVFIAPHKIGFQDRFGEIERVAQSFLACEVYI